MRKKTIEIRISPQSHAKLKTLAKEEKRTNKAQIELLIERAII